MGQPKNGLPRKTDTNLALFMGSEFDLSNIKTVGQLRTALQEMMDSLPNDPDMEISKIHGRHHLQEYETERYDETPRKPEPSFG